MTRKIQKTLDESNIVSTADTNRIIVEVNDKLCEISGFTREEPIDKPHNIIRHPSTPKEVFRES
ncbi:MAG: PAS domain S-box protein [Wolinella sp.]